MAEERPNIRPSDQLLPGALGSTTQDPFVNERMDTLPISDVFSIPLADIPVDEWAEPMQDHLCQPWDCEARNHSVIVMDRVSSSPWLCKIDNNFFTAKYMFTVDYTDSDIADDPAQHKQSHVMYLLDAGAWTGNIVALPNNRVRATSPALWVTGEGAPDFTPSQWLHSAESHESYLDPFTTFNNLYSDGSKSSNNKKKNKK